MKVLHIVLDKYDIIEPYRILYEKMEIYKYTMEDENYLKFPSVLREKLRNGEISFSRNTRFSYQPMQAYRGIQRSKNNYEPVSKKDFLSYAEKNVCRRGINKNDAHYYGVSLFVNKESVENALNFPRKDKKIAVGKVYEKAGPSELNQETGHICWWLYEDAEIEGFSIIRGDTDE